MQIELLLVQALSTDTLQLYYLLTVSFLSSGFFSQFAMAQAGLIQTGKRSMLAT